MTVQDQSLLRTPTVNALRVDGGWLVTASPNHEDADWQRIIVQLHIEDVVVNNDDLLATADGRLIWWVADE